MKFATLNVIVRELAKGVVPRALDLDFHCSPHFDGWVIDLHDFRASPTQHAREHLTGQEVYQHGKWSASGVVDLVHEKLRNLVTWLTPIQFRIGTRSPKRLQRRALGVRHPNRLRPRWGRP